MFRDSLDCLIIIDTRCRNSIGYIVGCNLEIYVYRYMIDRYRSKGYVYRREGKRRSIQSRVGNGLIKIYAHHRINRRVLQLMDGKKR